MTPQEQDMIADLIERVQKTQLDEKDPDAEQMLQQGLGRAPDALYILAQTVLVQKYALDQAQSQLSDAKAQIEQLQQHPEPRHATSFLGSLLGRNQDQAPPPPPQGYAPPPPYAPVPPAGYGYAPGYGAPPQPAGGGFLQNAMQTAAGVAAGALAFEGVESLMHGFGHAAGYGGGSGFGGFGGGDERPVENVVNNYYDDDRGEHGAHDVSPAEQKLGDEENYGTDDDNTDTEVDDASFDDSSNDFDDGSSGGGDDSNYG